MPKYDLEQHSADAIKCPYCENDAVIEVYPEHKRSKYRCFCKEHEFFGYRDKRLSRESAINSWNNSIHKLIDDIYKMVCFVESTRVDVIDSIFSYYNYDTLLKNYPYHIDWNKIMVVVDKIENITFYESNKIYPDVDICTKEVRIKGYEHLWDDYAETYFNKRGGLFCNTVHRVENGSNLYNKQFALFNTCSRFIELFNERNLAILKAKERIHGKV